MADKTAAELAVAPDVQDGDLFMSYRGSGPLKSVLSDLTKAYVIAGAGGTSGHKFGYLDGANTLSAVQTVSPATATTAADYLVLKPTDYGVGKPGLFISKEATAGNWQMKLFDGSAVGGELDLQLTLLQITGALQTSDALLIGGAAAFGQSLTVAGAINYTGSPNGFINSGGGTTLDCSVADLHIRSISSNTSYTLQGGAAGKSAGMAVDLTLSSGAVPTFTGAEVEGGVALNPGNGRSLFGLIWNGAFWTVYLIAAVTS